MIARHHLPAALGLLLVWLALARSVTPGQVVAGAVVALAALTAVPLGPGARLRWGRLPRLVLTEVAAVARSTLEVLREVVTPGSPDAGLVDVHVPGALPGELSWLGTLLTLTPGTYVVDVDPVGQRMRLHVIDATDPDALAGSVQGLADAVGGLFGAVAPRPVRVSRVRTEVTP